MSKYTNQLSPEQRAQVKRNMAEVLARADAHQGGRVAKLNLNGVPQSEGGFWSNLGRNLGDTPARMGQVVTHGITDGAQGLARLVRLNGVANAVNNFQSGIDNWLDDTMSDEMRNEYQDNKFGRAMGELSSTAIGLALPMPKVGKLGRVATAAGQAGNIAGRAATAAGQAGNIAGRTTQALGKWDRVYGPVAKALNRTGELMRTPDALTRVTRGMNQAGELAGRLGTTVFRGLNKVLPGVSRVMRSATPEGLSQAASLASLAGNIRGRDIMDRPDFEYGGDVNPVMHAKDWINEWRRRAGTRLGNDDDYKANFPAMLEYDRRYHPEQFIPGEAEPLSFEGRNYYKATGPTSEDFVPDANGRPVPVMLPKGVGSSAQRAMHDAQRHGDIELNGFWGSGLLGDLLFQSKAGLKPNPVPVYDDAGRIVNFSAKPRLVQETPENGVPYIYVPRTRRWLSGNTAGDALEQLGGFVPYTIPGVGQYTIDARLLDAVGRGDYAGAASALAYMAAMGIKLPSSVTQRLPARFQTALAKLAPSESDNALTTFGKNVATGLPSVAAGAGASGVVESTLGRALGHPESEAERWMFEELPGNQGYYYRPLDQVPPGE